MTLPNAERLAAAIEQPNAEGSSPFPYQREGIAALAHNQRFMLLDEMGLGKSPQSIRAADAIGARTILVVCMAIARENWRAKFLEWGLISRSLFVVNTGKDIPPATADVVIISYSLLPKFAKSFGDRPWDVAIIDEAQSLKNMAAKRTKAAYDGKIGALRNAKNIWLLTGTLVKNHPGEMFPHLRALFHAPMTTAKIPTEYWSFLRRYCQIAETPFGIKPVGIRPETIGELKAFLKPLMIARKQEDVLADLPPIIFEQTLLPGTVDIRDLAEIDRNEELFITEMRLRDRGISEEEVERNIDMILEHAEVSSRFRRLSGLAKVDGAIELLRGDLEAGLSKVIVFAHHREVIEKLIAGLTDYGVAVVDGSRSVAQKINAQNAFNGSPNTRVFIAQIDSASTSIDLYASEVVFVESSWVPSDNMQAIKRAHGIKRGIAGQPLRVRFLSLTGSVDEALTKTLRRKTQMLRGLFN